MKIRAAIARLDRLQRTRTFKVIASCVVVAAAVIGLSWYAIAVLKPAAGAAAEQQTVQAGPGQQLSPEEQRLLSNIQASQRILQEILAAKANPTLAVVTVTSLTAVALIVIWLGLGLTYLALLLLAAGVAYPLHQFEQTEALSRILVGIVALTASLTALLRLFQLALSGPGAVFAIARNTLTEAVRMKVSLVFIVLLIIGLAALPGLLDEEVPLRYRVQTFLQYGTGGSYLLIALLTLFFSASTVAFEQRDKIIWQTITKPVAPGKYLLGKWLGVVTLNAALLIVCATGIFLFTEYLRGQPAQGEREAYQAAGGGLTLDRQILETSVLKARRVVHMSPAPVDEKLLREAIDMRVEMEKQASDVFREAESRIRARVEEDLRKSIQESYRAIPPGGSQVYEFAGLGGAAASRDPLSVRYRIESGANRPDVTFRVTFLVSGMPPIVEEVTLANTHYLDLLPTVIDPDGVLRIEVINGELRGTQLIANPGTISFPADTLVALCTAGTYQGNFARVVAVLWLKLAFLSIVAIAASTFLSFPVACLVAVGIFFAAEGASFLQSSLAYYEGVDREGNVVPHEVVIRSIAWSVAWLFSVYADLKPTTKLVDGHMLTLGSVFKGAAAIALAGASLFGAGVLIFRNRELALYSGH